MPPNPNWNVIVRHYEQRLKQYGATPQGADWPNGADLASRFGVMLELLREADQCPALLDLGCGAGLLLDYLAHTRGIDSIDYCGIDASMSAIDLAKTRWPEHEFVCRDILADPLPEQSVDFVVMNGVLTERVSLHMEAMTEFAEALIAAAFRLARVGLAFNVMSAHVEWERPDLFHWRFDALAAFLKRAVSRHFTFRADYGLHEYTCFIWREPRRPAARGLGDWWSR